MSSASDERAALVAAARESIAKGSKSFALASNLFDQATRERAWLLYAWCRACDDIVDGQDHGHGMTAVADAEARVAIIAEKTTAALAGRVVGDMPFDALRVVAAETGLPARFAHDLVAGFRLDAEDWRPRSESDLYRYCYHVAGAVGCMMAVVMGVDPADEDTLDRLEGEGRVAFRYAENCNGSRRDIAGVLNAAGNVLGMMPHPERAVDTAHGGTDGLALFEGAMRTLADA